MVEKYGAEFQACFKLFDHAAHNGFSYLNGHCFVSIMLHVPFQSADGIIYLSVPLGYRLWIKEISKLELATEMVRSVIAALAPCSQATGVNILRSSSHLILKTSCHSSAA